MGRKRVLIPFRKHGTWSRWPCLPEFAGESVINAAASCGFVVGDDFETKLGGSSPIVVAKNLEPDRADERIAALRENQIVAVAIRDLPFGLAFRVCRFRNDILGRNGLRLVYLIALLVLITVPFDTSQAEKGLLLGVSLAVQLEIISFAIWLRGGLLEDRTPGDDSPIGRTP